MFGPSVYRERKLAQIHEGGEREGGRRRGSARANFSPGLALPRLARFRPIDRSWLLSSEPPRLPPSASLVYLEFLEAHAEIESIPTSLSLSLCPSPLWISLSFLLISSHLYRSFLIYISFLPICWIYAHRSCSLRFARLLFQPRRFSPFAFARFFQILRHLRFSFKF